MFGRLVTNSPSTSADVRPSASADSRRVRGSATRGELARESAKRCLVSEGAESAHNPDCRRSKHGMPALGLAREDVREMNLHERHRDRRERVTNRETRVRIRTRVDHDTIDLAPPRVNAIDHLAFTVVLGEFEIRADLLGDAAKRLLD